MNKISPQKTFYGQKQTAKCALTSQDRFCVELTGFSNEALQIFKTIPSRSYDPKTRNWSFHIKDYEMLISKLRTLQAKLNVEKIPGFVLNCIRVPQDEVIIDYTKLDPALSSTLLPFQLEGLSFGIDKKGRCLIADDMGLGKTFQALAIANYYKEDWPMLIVTTASMKAVWEETIRNYLPSVPNIQVQYMVSGRDYIGDSKILIVSHDMMSRALDGLLDRSFGVLIIDESHVLKSFKTKCYRSAHHLAKKARRVILLSGTPALSRPCELFTQLNIIDDKFFGNFFDFSKRYCDAKQTIFGWDASGKSNLKELEIILAKKFMIRRTKEDVLKALPNKKQEIVTLDTKLEEFSEEDRECLIALGKKYNSHKRSAERHALLLTYFSETAKIKIPSVCSHILQMLEKKVKFLVFAHHQVMLNAIEDIVKKKNLKYIRIDGSTTSDQRKYFISKFQLDDSYLCAILSITAANAGITLTAAKYVIFAELHWNPSIISQAEARAHRIGQEDTVIVQYLIAQNTSDESMWLLLQEKQETLKQFGLCKENFDNVEVKKQENTAVTKGLELNVSVACSSMDIRSYLSPQKKRKHSESEIEDMFNDGFDEILCKHVALQEEELFNDGMDEILCDIDF
ncbi:SWI/SNF-related matrix-associated actin-dependent regulator of chromatin subfamily A-like protein 1 [Anoplophora glabripennis]|nr:SWI/SNF-related matrix-associated actin-dependent regulator of chromatin subfamily A-like protein 1 [Anoplophora glabripennis]